MAAPTTTNTAIVIVPGAWHPAHLYTPLSEKLNVLSLPTTIVSLPSLNPLNPQNTNSADGIADEHIVREHVLRVLREQGRDVVIFAHSYGGICAGGAARGLGKEGGTRGVIGSVFLSGFAVREGRRIVDFFGGRQAPYLVADRPSKRLCTVRDSCSVFYNDMPPSTAKNIANQLLPHAMLALESPAPPTAWAEPAFQGRLAYIKCMRDQALPPFLQDMFVEKSGVEWIRREVDASHGAFVSQAGRLAEVVGELAGQWA